MRKRTITPLLLLLTAAGCDGGADPVRIEAMGELYGLVAIDRNGNEQVDAEVDGPVTGIEVRLQRPSGEVVETATSDAGGVVHFTGIPAGSYRLSIPETALGDTLRLVGDEVTATVTASAPGEAIIVLGYPTATAEEVRALPSGRMVAVHAVASHGAPLFTDTTLHVADETGSIRLARFLPRQQIQGGDSLRVVGRVGSYLGQPALYDAAVFVRGQGQPPAPEVVNSAEAASARAGALDGALVQVVGARVLDVAQLSNGNVRLRVTDGSGTLQVVIDRGISFTTEDPVLPGISVDVTGVLVPNEDGEWRLKPRGSGDFRAVLPQLTISGIRQLEVGSPASLHAIALAGGRVFGDNTLHVSDETGSIRVTGNGLGSIFAADSLRIVGSVGIREGQPVLNVASVSVLGRTATPPPFLMSTGVAATAAGGARDAALVEIRSATINTVASLGGDPAIVVDDGSGPVVVVFDRDTGIGAAAYAAGDRVDVVGLLVPTGGAQWVLKPRSPNDVRRMER